MTSFRGSAWTIGTKDDKVYWEVWDPERTVKIVDGTLDIESAHDIGKAFIDTAVRQGWSPKEAGDGPDG